MLKYAYLYTLKNFKMDEKITCPICQKSLDNVNDVVTLREQGSQGINSASRGCNDLIQTVPGQKVHQACRREFKGLMEKKNVCRGSQCYRRPGCHSGTCQYPSSAIIPEVQTAQPCCGYNIWKWSTSYAPPSK